MGRIEVAEYRERQQKLAKKLRANQLDAFLLTQNVDIYYLTGTMQTGFLLVPAEGEPIFYVKRSVARASDEAACRVESLDSMRTWETRVFSQLPQLDAANNGRPSKIATEYDVLPVQQLNRLQKALPNVQWADGSLIMRELRMIKSESEIACIRHCAEVIDIALEEAVSTIHVGMTDLELMTRIEQVIRKHGHAGLMRMRGYNQEIVTGMVASGADAAIPSYFDGPAGGRGLYVSTPQGSGRKPIHKNEPILIDIGCCIDGYVIDQTRTAVIGQLSETLATAYATSEYILRRTEELLKPGSVCEDIYRLSVELAQEAGLSNHFMGYGADQVRFLGHGIGLEIDEFPVLAKGFQYQLEPGMVIAIEPKFTFPGEGVVGIENTYVITQDGFEKLTISREGVLAVEL